MLQELSINNIVLIAKCEVQFGTGLCVLTGETGAGKSILLDALGLILGHRADTKLVRAGEEKASVCGTFSMGNNAELRASLHDMDIEAEDTLVIRRSVHVDGKSRCFINDSPVSVNALKRVGECLVEIHGQHMQNRLMAPGYQRMMLDTYAGNHALLDTVKSAYNSWQEYKKEYEACAHQLMQAQREQEFLQHMCDELEALCPIAGESDALAQKRHNMMQSQKLSTTLKEVYDTLNTHTDVNAALLGAQRILLRSSDAQIQAHTDIVDALDRAQNELEIATQAIETLRHSSDYNENDLETAEERLFALKDAARKYQCDVDGLEALLHDTKAKLQAVRVGQDALKSHETAMHKARETYIAQSDILHKKREVAVKKLEKSLHKELAPLKMQATRMRTIITPLQEHMWSSCGADHIEFEVATNAGAAFAPLNKIASGGELSRFMLAFNVVLCTVNQHRTLIFDEIDAGTGGAVAHAIGERLALLARNTQILVVTHSPQVATKGGQHFFIAKETKKKQTFTTITPLSDEARKEEIARMLAAEDITDEARAAAEKLIEMAG